MLRDSAYQWLGLRIWGGTTVAGILGGYGLRSFDYSSWPSGLQRLG